MCDNKVRPKPINDVEMQQLLKEQDTDMDGQGIGKFTSWCDK
jgi:hypothetical protein